MMGKHVVKTWSTTQAVVALSSGEAEYYGLVRGGSLGLGVQAMLRELGVKKKLRLKTDASAAKGIASRKGLGKIRHLEVNQLWLQDKVASGEVELEKVDGKVNRADALTKAVNSEELRSHIEWVNMELTKGRHEIMPEVEKKGEGARACEHDDVAQDLTPLREKEVLHCIFGIESDSGLAVPKLDTGNPPNNGQSTRLHGVADALNMKEAPQRYNKNSSSVGISIDLDCGSARQYKGNNSISFWHEEEGRKDMRRCACAIKSEHGGVNINTLGISKFCLQYAKAGM